jgi:hypothetical protein
MILLIKSLVSYM